MNTTDTPRTDAHVESRFTTWDTRTADADFARELERELAAAHDEIVTANGLLYMAMKREAKLRRLLGDLADCYFRHRQEGLLELMMRAGRAAPEHNARRKGTT